MRGGRRAWGWLSDKCRCLQPTSCALPNHLSTFTPPRLIARQENIERMTKRVVALENLDEHTNLSDVQEVTHRTPDSHALFLLDC